VQTRFLFSAEKTNSHFSGSALATRGIAYRTRVTLLHGFGRLLPDACQCSQAATIVFRQSVDVASFSYTSQWTAVNFECSSPS
jgi:hypothetical protein